MSLPFIFGKKKKEEIPDITITSEELKEILNSTPLISSNITTQAEIINLITARELNHLKKQMWKFYHK